MVTIRQIKKYATVIAQALHITGPFIIQFMATGNDVMVIECNLRAGCTSDHPHRTKQQPCSVRLYQSIHLSLMNNA